MGNLIRARNIGPVIAGVTLMALFSGCFSGSMRGKRLARYSPRVSDRSPWLWDRGSAQDSPSEPYSRQTDSRRQKGPDVYVSGEKESPLSRALRRGDRIVVYLRGIPKSEDIMEVVDELGSVTLPLIGTVKVKGKATSEAENLIEKIYIDGGYYNKINVIIVAQADEYFVRGEVKREGRYPLSGDLTLLQAIAVAGGYTDYANRRKVQLIRSDKKLFFNASKIEHRKEKDPLIRPEDIIVVHRRWY